MLLGLDAARGSDRSSLQLVEARTGRVIAMSDNVEFRLTDKPMFSEEELRYHSDILKGFNVSWQAEVKMTHKEVRRWKKQRREIVGKKPRLPRKKKKALNKRIRRMADDLADAFIGAESETILNEIF